MKNNKKKSLRNESGQALIIITFAIIALIGLTGLTVDGSLAYSDRRHAQNAADSAALAAALAHTRGENTNSAASTIATSNGYATNVVITAVASPADACPKNTAPNGVTMNLANIDYTVEITSTLETFFARVVGIPTMTNVVSATARACGTFMSPMFGGNAIVGCGNKLAAGECGYDTGSGNSTTWTITGGGIHTDTCAYAANANNVTLNPSSACVSAVNGGTGFANGDVCTGTIVPQCSDAYIDSIMPPDPCTSPAPTGIDVIKIEHVTLDNQTPSPITFSDGIYCIDEMDNGAYGGSYLSGHDIILDNATLYIRDQRFDLKFTGVSGGFAGTATSSGTYKGFAIIVALDEDTGPCPGSSAIGANEAQVMDYRGNSAGILQGTILAPTACIDMRGNNGNPSYEFVLNSQIIANKVSSNGNANITVNYIDDDNGKAPVYPTLELLK